MHPLDMHPTLDDHGDEAPLKQIIKTSEEGWFAKLAVAAKDKTPVLLIDDARVGINETSATLLDIGTSAQISKREWIATLSGLGLGTVGIALLIIAFLDPEPFSKLTVLVVGGTALVAGGGLGIIAIMTRTKVSVKTSARGFEITFG